MLKGWTTFEKVWLGVFTAINIYLFFAWGDSLLGLTSSMAGMLCVVLAAKGRISTFYVGLIQASTYAYISYTYGLYGEAMLNGLFYFPMQFVGIYYWKKNQVRNSVRGEDVRVRTMNMTQWIQLICVAAAGSILYALLLNTIGGQQAGLDAVTVVLSVIAQVLMVKRFVEQWILWIVINVLTIILWLIVLLQSGGNDWTMLVMWSAFLVNSIYAYYNWKKINREQKEAN
jgi:nicotinamide mononucleotide transporter